MEWLWHKFLLFLERVTKISFSSMDFHIFFTEDDIKDIEEQLKQNSIKPKSKQIVHLPQFKKKEDDDNDKN